MVAVRDVAVPSFSLKSLLLCVTPIPDPDLVRGGGGAHPLVHPEVTFVCEHLSVFKKTPLKKYFSLNHEMFSPG